MTEHQKLQLSTQDPNFDEILVQRCAQIKADERFKELVELLVRSNSEPSRRDLAQCDLGLLIHEYLFRKTREGSAPRFKTAKEDLGILAELLGDASTLYVDLMRNGTFSAALDQLQLRMGYLDDLIEELKLDDELGLYNRIPPVEGGIHDFLCKFEHVVCSAAECLEQDKGGGRTVAHAQCTADVWICVEGLTTLVYFQGYRKLTKNDFTVGYIHDLFALLRDYDDPNADWASGELNRGKVCVMPDVDRLVSWAAPNLRALQRAEWLHYFDQRTEVRHPMPSEIEAADEAERALQFGPDPRPRRKKRQ